MNSKDAHNITIERCTNANTSTTTLLEEMGVDFKLLVLKKDLVEANKNISRSLNIPIASYVYEIKRLLIVENAPLKPLHQLFAVGRECCLHPIND